jgi:2-amino-4-hydroxy-6-hydroxymethyldihydropteridine diphosphokinase
MYLNQLVAATTALTVDALQTALKDIEIHLGRTDDDRRQGIVRIDLDLLQYEQQRYHLRDWDRYYVKELIVKLDHDY